MNLEDENGELKQKYGENEKILLMKNDEIEILKTSLELAQGETQPHTRKLVRSIALVRRHSTVKAAHRPCLVIDDKIFFDIFGI